MATIKLDFGKKNADGMYKVSFRIRHNGTEKRIPTQVLVGDDDLTRNKKGIRNPKKAQVVERMRRTLQDRLFDLSLDLVGREVDAAYIVERLTAHPETLDFFKFADEWVAEAEIKGVKNYKTMLNALEKHLSRRQLPFENITYSMLEGFERFLSDRPRAQSQYIGYIRHLYREAMRKYNTDYEQVIKNDPFMRYKVPRQKMMKGVRSLSLEELIRIYDYEGSGHDRATLARDTFILSFCLMGMNSADMYAAHDMKDNVLRYNRAKTKDRRSDGAYIEVRVHPFLRQLMSKYKGDRHIFNFYKRYSSPEDFNRALNIGLKEVGKAVGIEGLQFYQARHTFATLSRNLMKFSKSDVDEALNHVGTMDIADVYIKKDFSIINENNFKLIERVFQAYL